MFSGMSTLLVSAISQAGLANQHTQQNVRLAELQAKYVRS